MPGESSEQNARPDRADSSRAFPLRELRFMGRRCQWVVSGDQLALWVGDMAQLGGHRTIFNLRLRAGWEALRGVNDRA